MEHLPPLTIEFIFPLNYPSSSCPKFILKCEWLSSDQLSKLSKKFESTWEENEGLVVLFLWISLIKDDLLDLFEIHSELAASNEQNQDPLDYEGTLETWKFDKNYGFIKSTELERDIFVHISELKFEPNHEKIKGKVLFQKGHNKRNKKEMAVNVRLKLESSSNNIGFKNDENDKQEPKLVRILKLHQEEEEIKIFNKQFFECNVCFIEKPGKSCLRFIQCSHVFCNECMKSYFEVQINEGQMTNLICPNHKCTAQALPTQVKALVSSKHYQLYEDCLLSTTLETMSDVILCPLRHCQCPTLIDREASMGQCPKCDFAFCIYCKSSFHGVAPCRYVAYLIFIRVTFNIKF